MNRRGFVGAGLAGLGSFFWSRKTEAIVPSCLTENKWKILLRCEDINVLNYFKRVVRWLNLEQKVDEIDAAYARSGRAFVHLDIECSICHAMGFGPDAGTTCDHPNGTVKTLTIMNSDFVVKSGDGYAIIPDNNLIQIVESGGSRAINIPDGIQDLVKAGQPIPLSNRTLVVVDSPVCSEMIEDKIFRPIVEMQGFDCCPKVIWDGAAR